MNKKGFTLIEVFLVASLVGLVLVTIFSVYGAGINIWKTLKRLELIEKRQFVLSMEKINRELVGYLREFKEIPFEGDSESISFPYVKGREIVKVTYIFDKGKDALLRKVLKYTDSLKEKMMEEETELFTAQDVTFFYFNNEIIKTIGVTSTKAGEEAEEEAENAAEEDAPEEWLEIFSEKENGIPEVIRLDIKKEDKTFSEFIFIPH